jgi:predicted Mrr-cat superfamily restriction endonuclease
MKKGDWIALPSKNKPTIAMIQILAECEYDTSASNDYTQFKNTEELLCVGSDAS